MSPSKNWKEITLGDFVDFVYHHKMVDERVVTDTPDGEGLGAIFDDGTTVVFCSKWSGPYSECTPDIDKEPPTIWWRKP